MRQKDFALHYLKFRGTFSASRCSFDELKTLHKAFTEWRKNTGYDKTELIALDTVRRHLDSLSEEIDGIGKAYHKNGTVTYFYYN